MKAHQYFYHEDSQFLRHAGIITYPDAHDVQTCLSLYQEKGKLVVLTTDDGVPIGFTSAAGAFTIHQNDDDPEYPPFYACNAHTNHVEESDVNISADFTLASIVLDRGFIPAELGHGTYTDRVARLAVAESVVYLAGMRDTHEQAFIARNMPHLGYAVEGGSERLVLNLLTKVASGIGRTHVE